MRSYTPQRWRWESCVEGVADGGARRRIADRYRERTGIRTGGVVEGGVATNCCEDRNNLPERLKVAFTPQDSRQGSRWRYSQRLISLLSIVRLRKR